ncbi:hypothetical protein WDW89_03290, partial [Deltaproteobacteria bacterium TL4]
MYTKIILLLLSLVVITSPSFAGDVTFGEAKTAVSGADAQQLEVNNLDGDSKPDLIWRDSSGNLKYSLQAGINLENRVWTQVTASAGWCARFDPISVVFDNKIWVLGGITENSVHK